MSIAKGGGRSARQPVRLRLSGSGRRQWRLKARECSVRERPIAPPVKERACQLTAKVLGLDAREPARPPMSERGRSLWRVWGMERLAPKQPTVLLTRESARRSGGQPARLLAASWTAAKASSRTAPRRQKRWTAFALSGDSTTATIRAIVQSSAMLPPSMGTPRAACASAWTAVTDRALHPTTTRPFRSATARTAMPAPCATCSCVTPPSSKSSLRRLPQSCASVLASTTAARRWWRPGG